jgi:protein-L-isoaspartate(D-aspartate) O-methyltransferase
LSREDWNGLIDDLTRCGILRSPRVIRAMRLVPRSLFLPESQKPYAAIDAPLPIGFGQTVSAPQG